MNRRKRTEARKDVLRQDLAQHIATLVLYWEKQTGTESHRLEGLAFSILTTLDGESGQLPGYRLMTLDTNEEVGGWLHEAFFPYLRSMRARQLTEAGQHEGKE